MVEKEEEGLSIVQQCILLSICRSGIYYQPVSESELDLEIMLEIDKYYTLHPFYGTRRMSDYLKWATDITYIPMAKGHMYLCAIIDLFTRKVLSWGVSNTMDTAFCIEVLKDALLQHGKPEIFNSDQGSQFTSPEFTDVLKDQNITISMDGRGRALDNIFIERLWRSVKYECIYLNAFENGAELYYGLDEYFRFYNTERKHQSLDNQTPDSVYKKIA
jgi:putative transposase